MCALHLAREKYSWNFCFHRTHAYTYMCANWIMMENVSFPCESQFKKLESYDIPSEKDLGPRPDKLGVKRQLCDS